MFKYGITHSLKEKDRINFALHLEFNPVRDMGNIECKISYKVFQ